MLEIDPTLEFQIIVKRHKISRMKKLGNNRGHFIVHWELNTPPNK